MLHPRVRRQFNDSKATLRDLHEKVEKYTGPFELPEPDEELRATIEKIVDHEVRNVPDGDDRHDLGIGLDEL